MPTPRKNPISTDNCPGQPTNFELNLRRSQTLKSSPFIKWFFFFQEACFVNKKKICRQISATQESWYFWFHTRRVELTSLSFAIRTAVSDFPLFASLLYCCQLFNSEKCFKFNTKQNCFLVFFSKLR